MSQWQYTEPCPLPEEFGLRAEHARLLSAGRPKSPDLLSGDGCALMAYGAFFGGLAGGGLNGVVGFLGGLCIGAFGLPILRHVFRWGGYTSARDSFDSVDTFSNRSMLRGYQDAYSAWEARKKTSLEAWQTEERRREEDSRRERDFWFVLDDLGFEREVAQLLARLGHRVQLTPRTRDGGIDVLVDDDTAAQCKHHKTKVSVSAVRDLVGTLSLAGRTRGVLVCPSGFTKGARDAAAKAGVIQLWDVDDLIRMQTSLFDSRAGTASGHPVEAAMSAGEFDSPAATGPESKPTERIENRQNQRAPVVEAVLPGDARGSPGPRTLAQIPSSAWETGGGFYWIAAIGLAFILLASILGGRREEPEPLPPPATRVQTRVALTDPMQRAGTEPSTLTAAAEDKSLVSTFPEPVATHEPDLHNRVAADAPARLLVRSTIDGAVLHCLDSDGNSTLINGQQEIPLPADVEVLPGTYVLQAARNDCASIWLRVVATASSKSEVTLNPSCPTPLSEEPQTEPVVADDGIQTTLGKTSVPAQDAALEIFLNSSALVGSMEVSLDGQVLVSREFRSKVPQLVTETVPVPSGLHHVLCKVTIPRRGVIVNETRTLIAPKNARCLLKVIVPEGAGRPEVGLSCRR
jgi:hypothetical protein